MSATSFQVRRLTAEDAEAYRDLRLEGLSRHPEAFGSAYEEDARKSLAEWQERLATSAVFGGFQAESLVGTAGLFRQGAEKTRHKALLVGVYVQEQARGSGLARALVEAVIEEARGQVEQLLTSVGASNAPARRLYEALGFRAWGVQPRSLKVGERYVDEVEMVLFLEEPQP